MLLLTHLVATDFFSILITIPYVIVKYHVLIPLYPPTVTMAVFTSSALCHLVQVHHDVAILDDKRQKIKPKMRRAKLPAV